MSRFSTVCLAAMFFFLISFLVSLFWAPREWFPSDDFYYGFIIGQLFLCALFMILASSIGFIETSKKEIPLKIVGQKKIWPLQVQISRFNKGRYIFFVALLLGISILGALGLHYAQQFFGPAKFFLFCAITVCLCGAWVVIEQVITQKKKKLPPS